MKISKTSNAPGILLQNNEDVGKATVLLELGDDKSKYDQPGTGGENNGGST